MRGRTGITIHFKDEINLMVSRACRINKITEKQLAERLGYTPESLSRVKNGAMVEGMPIGKLIILMDLSRCDYSWERKDV